MQHEYDIELAAETRNSARHTGPSFTAYETPESRVPRLAEAYGHARGAVQQMSVRYQNAFDDAVLNMHDHQGTLEVTWRDHEARIIFEGVIAGGWEGVGEHIVEHRLAKGR